MKIEELIKLALVNHDIDQDKIMNNVLKKGRRRVAIKKVMISIVITALIAVPVLVISYGIAKSGDQQPYGLPVTSSTQYASASATMITQPQTGISSTASYTKRKIVVGKEEDRFYKESYDFLSDNLSKAFEKYDADTEFLITVEFVSRNMNDFLYKGKTVEEWSSEAQKARLEYNDIHNGNKDGDEFRAKRIMENVEAECIKANEELRRKDFSDVEQYLAEKGIETVSESNKSRRVDIISSSDKILEIINENSKKSNINYRFILGHNTGMINNADILYE